MKHKYSIGQLVGPAGSRFPDRTDGIYQVVRLMPESNGEFAYRIKNVVGPSERAVRESEIEALQGDSARSD